MARRALCVLAAALEGLGSMTGLLRRRNVLLPVAALIITGLAGVVWQVVDRGSGAPVAAPGGPTVSTSASVAPSAPTGTTGGAGAPTATPTPAPAPAPAPTMRLRVYFHTTDGSLHSIDTVDGYQWGEPLGGDAIPVTFTR